MDCDKLESLKLSDISTDEKSPTPSIADTIVTVPSTFTEFPLGFALDAGGSVTKIVYRSKLDYTDGHPNGGKHSLRLRFFKNGDGDALIEFLKENCDVRSAPQIDGSDERPLYYQTGLGVQHYVKKLEDTFHCRIKLIPETDASYDGILHVVKSIPELNQNVPFSVQSTKPALDFSRDFLKMMTRFIDETGSSPFGELPPPREGFDMPAYMAKLQTIDAESLAAELSAEPVTYPCVIVQCGSGTNCTILHENGRCEMGDYKPTAGKTILGLGRLVTGAKNFEELVELASRGDRQKVNLTILDLKKESEEEDWYHIMPDSYLAFTLGKTAEERFDGTYSKADLAAALLHMHCYEVVHFSHNFARLRNINSIMFCGSFADWPLTQQLIQECFLLGSLQSPLFGEQQRTMSIIPKCGFLPALGVWYKNNNEALEAKGSSAKPNLL